ncbi:MAG: hypothetical protein D6679_04545 [Candidatus Hydrogenedentota bacterium]|nr:MAG: hypothetical protein D6679_04545 [Candidatus Hydrogenedentota bacterium]
MDPEERSAAGTGVGPAESQEEMGTAGSMVGVSLSFTFERSVADHLGLQFALGRETRRDEKEANFFKPKRNWEI